ncbi:MAG: hypothetical protein OXI52_03380 [Caldilineaceae bacterium]|nr:hypothetical protein [Caldilineaceae bacterium]
MIDASDRDLTGWEVRANVDQQALYNLLECVMEIAQALQSLVGTRQAGTEANVFVVLPLMVSSARRISTSIRKLMLDGNGSLLKRSVVEPNIHPLKVPYSTPPVNFVRHFEEKEFTLVWADGPSSDVTVPAINHTVTIHPLYGVRHIAGTKFGLYNPFDHVSEPIKFQNWMNTRVIEIDGHQFRARQLLRDMANKEGAHIENNHAFFVPEDTEIGKDKNTLHRFANGVRFGGLTYLQLFSLFTGLYIVNRTRTMLRQLPFLGDDEAATYIRDTITHSPRRIAVESADIQFTSAPLVAVGPDRGLMGDYSSGMKSNFKVPERGAIVNPL